MQGALCVPPALRQGLSFGFPPPGEAQSQSQGAHQDEERGQPPTLPASRTPLPPGPLQGHTLRPPGTGQLALRGTKNRHARHEYSRWQSPRILPREQLDSPENQPPGPSPQNSRHRQHLDAPIAKTRGAHLAWVRYAGPRSDAATPGGKGRPVCGAPPGDGKASAAMIISTLALTLPHPHIVALKIPHLANPGIGHNGSIILRPHERDGP